MDTTTQVPPPVKPGVFPKLYTCPKCRRGPLSGPGLYHHRCPEPYAKRLSSFVAEVVIAETQRKQPDRQRWRNQHFVLGLLDATHTTH